MKSFLLSVLFCSVAYSQGASFIKLPALDEKYHISIAERYISEIECIKKLDAVIKTRWSEELNKIPTTDLGNLTKIPWKDKDSAYTRYNSFQDEWLMKEGSPTNRINECVHHLVSDVSNPAVERDLDCLTKLLSTNIYEEANHQRDYENLVNISSGDQLPFRKFISFPEVVELIFQNRELNTWTNLERLLYAHTKSYVLTEVDNIRRNYIPSQNCDWINIKALRDAPSDVARLNEFTSQIRHSVNKQLAGRLLKDWNLNTILPTDRYKLWLKSHQEMISELEREVETLRKQDKDAQWLCEHASELATNFTNVQSNILLTEDDSSVHLESSDIASMTRTIEIALAKVNDTRHAAIRKVADKQDEEVRCLSSLISFLQNHRRYELASAFIDEEYEYPEIYCENPIKNEGLIRFTFCNCIGSFCVSHHLVALFSEEYALVKSSDGIYKIVRSGIKSKRKVNHCHTLANSNIKLSPGFDSQLV